MRSIVASESTSGVKMKKKLWWELARCLLWRANSQKSRVEVVFRLNLSFVFVFGFSQPQDFR